MHETPRTRGFGGPRVQGEKGMMWALKFGLDPQDPDDWGPKSSGSSSPPIWGDEAVGSVESTDTNPGEGQARCRGRD